MVARIQRTSFFRKRRFGDTEAPILYRRYDLTGLSELQIVFAGWDVARATDPATSEEVLGLTLIDVEEGSAALLITATDVLLNGLYYSLPDARPPLGSEREWFFRIATTGQSSV